MSLAPVSLEISASAGQKRWAPLFHEIRYAISTRARLTDLQAAAARDGDFSPGAIESLLASDRTTHLLLPASCRRDSCASHPDIAVLQLQAVVLPDLYVAYRIS